MSIKDLYAQDELLIPFLSTLVAFIYGFIFVVLVPPWQHYDEPNHFEYVWLIANRPGLPQPGDYDQNMRRHVAQSMIENNFFDRLNFIPDLELPDDKPIWIGRYSQLHEPPLYYFLVSIPLRFINPLEIELGLLLARLVSLGLLIFTVVCSWGITSELTPPRHILRLLVPVTVALIPGFVDIMTSVNNSVGAVFAFSIFLWGSIRMITRGFSIFGLLWVISAAIICYFTKSTVYLALPALFLVLLFSIFQRGLWKRFAYSILVVTGLSMFILIFDWGDALYWARNPHQISNTRIKTTTAPFGQYAFILEVDTEISPREAYIRQIIPPELVREHSGQLVTFGTWIWASEPVTIRLPVLMDDFGARSKIEEVSIGTDPKFFASTTTFPDHTVRVWISLEPFSNKVEAPINVYYDGVIVTSGLYPLDEVPNYLNGRTNSGVWGSVQFTNLIRNSTAEYSSPRVRPWVDKFGMEILPDRGRPSLILYSVIDRSAAGWYYQMAAENLVRTFWAKFGWGQVSLIGYAPYRIIALITLFGILGGFIGIIIYRRHIKWEVVTFLLIVTSIIWVMAWVRGAIYLFHPAFIPSARYAFPVFIPTTLFLVFGWHLILLGFHRVMKFPLWAYILVYFAMLIALDIIAVVSIIGYYA
ncbi:MAG: hypothetical protein IBX69_14015 [Anaerolineales bacterium]|nr:hypothetical protein [Anaerolineales bacterium]